MQNFSNKYPNWRYYHFFKIFSQLILIILLSGIFCLDNSFALLTITRSAGSGSPIGVTTYSSTPGSTLVSSNFYYLISIPGSDSNQPTLNNWFYNFTPFDLTKTAYFNASSESSSSFPNAITLQILWTSNQGTSSTSSTTTNYVLMIYIGASSSSSSVTASSTSWPISFAAYNGSLCGSGSCLYPIQPGSNYPYKYFAVPISSTQQSSVSITFYPSDMCGDGAWAGASGGTSTSNFCQTSTATSQAAVATGQALSITGSALEFPTSGNPVTVPVFFEVHTISSLTDPTVIPDASAVDSTSTNFYFTVDGPSSLTCPSSSAYVESIQLGDSSLSISPSTLISYTAVSGSIAPLSQIWAVMNQSNNLGYPNFPSGVENPSGTSELYASDGAFLSALQEENTGPIQSSPNVSNQLVVTGLINTTQTQTVLYNLAFLFEDQTGAIAAFSSQSSSDSSCFIEGIQVSEIHGFLKESKCFIATAAHMGVENWGVDSLRVFRDRVLKKFIWGKKTIDFYESISPQLANWLILHPAFRPVVLAFLLPLEFFIKLFLIGLNYFEWIFIGLGITIGIWQKRSQMMQRRG